MQRFDERIRALAVSQDLLVTGAWNAADLEKLIKSQLAHFRDLIGIRIVLQGPPLSVSASAAQAIGMAMHELATNAGNMARFPTREARWRLTGTSWQKTGAKTFSS